MSNSTKISGFTLIELIVVIVIISMMLVFSFPMFNNISLFSGSRGQVDDIARLADDLKTRAADNKADFFLHIDPSAKLLWVTHEMMDAQQKVLAKEEGVILPDNTQIESVQIARRLEGENDEYQIRFSKKGYSDFAHLLFDENDGQFTIQIEPFLAKSKIVNRHIYLEACN